METLDKDMFLDGAKICRGITGYRVNWTYPAYMELMRMLDGKFRYAKNDYPMFDSRRLKPFDKYGFAHYMEYQDYLDRNFINVYFDKEGVIAYEDDNVIYLRPGLAEKEMKRLEEKIGDSCVGLGPFDEEVVWMSEVGRIKDEIRELWASENESDRLQAVEKLSRLNLNEHANFFCHEMQREMVMHGSQKIRSKLYECRMAVPPDIYGELFRNEPSKFTRASMLVDRSRYGWRWDFGGGMGHVAGDPEAAVRTTAVFELSTGHDGCMSGLFDPFIGDPDEMVRSAIAYTLERVADPDLAFRLAGDSMTVFQYLLKPGNDVAMCVLEEFVRKLPMESEVCQKAAMLFMEHSGQDWFTVGKRGI